MKQYETAGVKLVPCMWLWGTVCFTYTQRHDLIGDQEEKQMEVGHDIQEYGGGALGQVCG